MSLISELEVADKADDMKNRRVSPRTDCNIPAFIKDNDTVICYCFIKDISDGGMCIYIPNGSCSLDKFVVTAPEIGTPVTVVKKWSKAGYIGVSWASSEKSKII